MAKKDKAKKENNKDKKSKNNKDPRGIGLTGKKKNQYPSKFEINFVSDQKEKQSRALAGIIVVLLIILALFVKFGIIDQIARVNRAKKHYEETEARLEDYRKQMESFKDVMDTYNEMTGAFMDEGEKGVIDRMEIFDVLAEDVFQYVEVQSINISDSNVIRITTSSTTISNVSEITHVLLADPRISYANARTAKVDVDNENIVTATIEIGYWGNIENEEE